MNLDTKIPISNKYKIYRKYLSSAKITEIFEEFKPVQYKIITSTNDSKNRYIQGYLIN